MSQIEALFLDLQERRESAAALRLLPVPNWIWFALLTVMPPKARQARSPQKHVEKLFLFPPIRAFRGHVVGCFSWIHFLWNATNSCGLNLSASTTTCRPEPKPLIRSSLPLAAKLRHWVITSRWQRWLFPFCCAVPYVAILLWLLSRGLIWVNSDPFGSSWSWEGYWLA